MKYIYFPFLFILISCGPSVKFQRCTEGSCKTEATFEDLRSCEFYSILNYSRINYNELLRTGSTMISYEKKVGDSSVSCIK